MGEWHLTKLRDLFASAGLESFPKTSGSKGLQVFLPLNTPTSYERSKPFAHAVAQRLEREMPAEVVSRMQKSLRTGKVLFDWIQNDAKKTTVSVYSLRARERPAVSTPVAWSEVEKALKSRKRLDFVAAEVLRRVEDNGDLFEPVLSLKQKLPSIASLQA